MSHQHHRPDFDGARVAVLLTGQTFRAVKRFGGDVAGFCVNASFGAQEAASRSVLSQVIEPLEASGAKVDVLFTFPRCEDAVAGSALLRALPPDAAHRASKRPSPGVWSKRSPRTLALNSSRSFSRTHVLPTSSPSTIGSAIAATAARATRPSTGWSMAAAGRMSAPSPACDVGARRVS